jgi:hypothetical protein
MYNDIYELRKVKTTYNLKQRKYNILYSYVAFRQMCSHNFLLLVQPLIKCDNIIIINLMCQYLIVVGR